MPFSRLSRSLRRATPALATAARLAIVDVLLVQWTSYVVAPAFVVVGAELDAALAAAIALASAACVGGAAFLIGSGETGDARAARLGALASVLPAILWALARSRTRGGSGTRLFLAVVVAVGCAALAGRRARRPRAADLAHGRSSSSSSPSPLVLALDRAIAYGSCAMWIGAAHGPRAGSAPWTALGVLAVWLADTAAATLGRIERGAWMASAATSLAIGAFASVATLPLSVTSGEALASATSGDRASESGSASTAATSPDVILVVLDTVSADHLSLYGYERATSPGLARFAEHADLYLGAISNASWTLPAHASLLTGLLPHAHGAHSAIARVSKDAHGAPAFELYQRPLRSATPTLASVLARHGWHTGAIVANHGWFSDHYGLLRGFQEADNRARNVLGIEPLGASFVRHLGVERLVRAYELASSSTFSAAEILARSDAWLARTPRPRFLLVNLMDAHAPYVAAHRALAEGAPAEGGDEAIRDARWTNRVRDPTRRYDLAIRHLDRVLGEWLDSLVARGIAEHAVVVVTADHGETFDRSGENGHGLNLYQSAIHVPLVVAWPGQKTGHPIATPVALVDVMPTLLARLGVEAPAALDGAPFGARRDPIVAENYFSALSGTYRSTVAVPAADLDRRVPSQWAVVDGTRKLIVSSDGRTRFFDLANDPGERRDLARERVAESNRLSEALERLVPAEAWVREHRPDGDLAAAPAIAEADAATRERLRTLGYAE